MLKQQLQLKLQQKLSPQQIQLMKLVQLPVLEFEQRVEQELQENPILEIESEQSYDSDFDLYNSDELEYQDSQVIETDDINIDEYLSDDEIPEYRLHSNDYAQEVKEIPYKSEESSYQILVNQLSMFNITSEQKQIATFLIGSINDNGYIDLSLNEIVDELAFTQGIYTDESTIERILNRVIFQLDPPGIGARDLQESLLIQLKRKTQSSSIALATQIVEDNFEAFSKKHYNKLQQKLEINEQELKQAVREIEKLNPKPGGGFIENTQITEHIIPDFTIQIVDGELELIINGRNAPELHISKKYSQMFETYKEIKDKTALSETISFIKQKLDAAKWFIDAVKQRQETLYITMSAIMQWQKDYFLTGDETQMKPLILKDIAALISMDISTVSRVVNSKYVSTPYGTKLLKDFFSESLENQQGVKVSTLEVKNILQNIIANEDKNKPLTDDQLVQELKDKGYPIARRTVTKYREQLKIPKAGLRKEL